MVLLEPPVLAIIAEVLMGAHFWSIVQSHRIIFSNY